VRKKESYIITQKEAVPPPTTAFVLQMMVPSSGCTQTTCLIQGALMITTKDLRRENSSIEWEKSFLVC